MSGVESTSTAPEVGAEFPYPVTVEIKGATKAATFTRLADAVEAVRSSVARLPLEEADAKHLGEMFAPESLGRIARQLDDFGAVRTAAWVGIEAYVIYLRPAQTR
ncbi:hypothetical protein [Kitasatospora sp. A2-31]|uniref:hypothetical protein n=1 Tax=Kitasatospora sp. A2-31 TaxID=2916414 RepID=UPI001EED4AF5|nr:hypothetical protein [Kitasatospora sp. A2-31]MCG6499619.1 hypothetical protein [Kitasatospora sp. A2-31]